MILLTTEPFFIPAMQVASAVVIRPLDGTCQQQAADPLIVRASAL